MRIKLSWEEETINEKTVRFKVYGGWIIEREHKGKNNVSVTNCFVPDHNHNWILPSPPKTDSDGQPLKPLSAGY